MNKLSAKAVQNAKPKTKEYKLSDGGGLYLRVRPSGAKSWLFCYRLPGNRQLIPMTLGSLKDLTLKGARNKLIELRKLVTTGVDPRMARAASKAENSQSITMQKLFLKWIDFERQTHKVTPLWIKRHEDRWRLHLKKQLENILAKDITRGHIAAVLDAMVRKGIKEETRKALTTLNLALDYGVNRHYIESNQARLLKPKDLGASANRPRTRALNLNELRSLWQALEQLSDLSPNSVEKKFPLISTQTIIAIKLLILTGARRTEVAEMQWAEVDLHKSIWEIPESRTKNRKHHIVYLSDLAKELLTTVRSISGSCKFVFMSAKTSKNISMHKDTLTWALNRIRKSKAHDLADLDPFTIHDLRRTAATSWAEYLKIQPHIIERMLNHQPLNKLIATYQRAIYADEQRDAWLAWGEFVETKVINSAENILSFHRVENF